MDRFSKTPAGGEEAWLLQYDTRGRTDPDGPDAIPELTPQPPRKYGEAQRIGAGGEKEILLVRDRDTLREVAMARPREGRPAAAFVREARILARLEHPNIVPLHDLGLSPDGSPYYTMKLLAGETLDAILARLRAGDSATESRFPLAARLEIFARVCDAVAFAHSRGIIHRDIKPANVQIGEYGEVRVIDWGLAKIAGEGTGFTDASDLSDLSVAPDTRLGTVKGTPGYMAPEQANGQGCRADVRTDTYALGALLYALLTGHAPVAGATSAERIRRTVAGEIVPPRQRAPERLIPHALDAIARKALAANPEDRYQTADALLADLRAFTACRATSAEEAGPVTLLWLVVKRHRALSAVIAASLLALAGISLAAAMQIRARERVAVRALANLHAEHALRTRLTRAAVPKLLADARAQIRGMAYDDALQTLRTAIGVDPSQDEAWDLAGWIYLGQERFERAQSAFRRDLDTLVERPAVGNGDVAPAVARRARGGKGNGINEAGLRLAEQALNRRRAGGGDIPPEVFQAWMADARTRGAKTARESRVALGVYCARHNPTAATNTAQRVLVQWAVAALNDARAELELRSTATGMEARVSGPHASDLLPLAGLPLNRLDLHGTAVRDLQPIRGMPLRSLDLSGAPVANFEPLYGLPLRELRAEGFRKLPADLFVHCPGIEAVTVSSATELSRQSAVWPANVKKVIRK
jgi:tetratricopeptide (TPR) repeat protein